ncbi:hypothetical protein M5W92_05905 [Paenibacillus apiarius]|uniref:Methyl-accepting chemotaxis protein n=1 Tax=Paenibacillus apiarius TaxID=46240 RepID=A0ABT4DVV2_9BACL|nr:hypothetical protein [Paenibacillus apiarius]MCY9551610.1 hypothetical protein [Paenibacillus apiarius]MCY9685148.1 hypothetical protein [Paenibacillus apiarius]MCY9724379.1 hypothetical protein [Paenibacillus apiarius]MCY9727754.1 hypothetical protein [Paenibacillus apiarius]
MNSMLSIYPKYLDAVTHALGLSRENKSQEAYDYIQTKGLAISNEIDDHVDSVNKLNIELAEQLRDVSSKQAASFTEQLNESVSQTSAASEHIAQNVQEIAEGADVFNHDSSRLR